MEQVWFTQGEAARYLRFSLAFFRRHVHAQLAIYVETAPRYSRADLDEFMARKRRDGIRPPTRKRRSAAAAATNTKTARLLAELGSKAKKRKAA